ncbi:hypothetical protein G9U51_03420 [Calidifontibacter sp. DB0510]|uniref:Primosomal protein n=1 Tax=Metallococcus carri TaxID=1656884 RepID=A0A967AY14_9MICO|nr:hypothetical protein [Metallococcus carri]NHN54833.1 hypothetical protein [Metallococcus carri]NOP37178.1 hypothetical protein [Calidifontibacter sp. DB2511S]
MTADPRAALSRFITALERHLEAAARRRGENDPTVVAAYHDLADAFEDYDDALLEAYGEVTPLELYVGDEDEDLDEDDDDEDVDDLDEDEGDDEGDDDLDEDDEDDDGEYSGLTDDDDLEIEDRRKR